MTSTGRESAGLRTLAKLDVWSNLLGAATLAAVACVPGIFEPRAGSVLWFAAFVQLAFGVITAISGRTSATRVLILEIFGVFYVSVLGLLALHPQILIACAVATVLIPLTAAMSQTSRIVYLLTALSSGAVSTLIFASEGDLVWRGLIGIITAGMTWAPSMTVLNYRLRLEAAIAAAHRVSVTDSLTGLLNRRGLAERLPALIASVVGPRYYLLILTADLDNFKTVNDTFGHASGDEVLRRVARILEGIVREQDLTARTGGEELVILAAVREASDLGVLAERLRRSIETELRAWSLTVSIGGMTVQASEIEQREGDATEWMWQLLDKADGLMYEAKTAGKNTVRLLAA